MCHVMCGCVGLRSRVLKKLRQGRVRCRHSLYLVGQPGPPSATTYSSTLFSSLESKVSLQPGLPSATYLSTLFLFRSAQPFPSISLHISRVSEAIISGYPSLPSHGLTLACLTLVMMSDPLGVLKPGEVMVYHGLDPAHHQLGTPSHLYKRIITSMIESSPL